MKLSGLIVLALLLTAVQCVAQTTIRVPADQQTIQGAIDAASAGDTVLVAPGTYYENIDFKGKAITVTSSGGASVTTIDGGRKNAVVRFRTGESSDSVISGFTITNGYNPFENNYAGSGIYISNASPQILNNIITRNAACAGFGLGVYINGGAAIVRGNSIVNNVETGGCSGGTGAGIDVGGAATGLIQIVDNLIAGNAQRSGSGAGISISVGGAGSLLVAGNIISGNTAYADGGGIRIYNGYNVQIVNNLIADNRATAYPRGGGIYVHVFDGSSGPLLLGNTFAGNDGSEGSAVYSAGYGGGTRLYNNLIIGKPGQPALHCEAPYDNVPTLRSNDIYSSGGAVYSGKCVSTGGSLVGVDGNISVDPLFVAPDVSNYHLQPGSPVIDVGDGSFPEIPSTDLAGWQRIYDGDNDGVAKIDIGAFEYAGKTSSELSTDSLVFEKQKVGTTSASIRVTIRNTGDRTLDVSSIVVTGDFAQTNTCRVSKGIAPGQSCTIDFTFTPKSRGANTGTATIVSNSSSSPQSIALQGQATAPIATVAPSSLYFGGKPVDTGSIIIVPKPQVNTSSPALSVTLRNDGDADLIVSSISTSGDFASTHNCGIIAPAATCTISTTFTPTVFQARTGTITIVDDAAGSPHTVALSGNGTGPGLSVSESSLYFGSQPIGSTSAGQLVMIRSIGTMPVTINSIGRTGDFLQSNTCAPMIYPGYSCGVYVYFKPTAYGVRSGTLTIDDNGVGGPHTVALKGTTAEPIPSPSATSLVFRNTTLVGQASPVETITLRNTGTALLKVTGIYTTTAEFSQTNDCSSLAVQASCSIHLTFKPADIGTRTGSLQILHNASGGMTSVPLYGTGIAEYPIPSLTSVSPTLVRIGASSTLTLTGAGFFPASVVYWGEQPLPTTFSSDTSLTATVPASLVADYGEYKVSVRSPSPGGGLSAQFAVTAYASIPANVRDMVYDPNRRLLYAATTSPNAILEIDPASHETSTISLSSDPNKLALSDDGQFLYVGLKGSGAIARISLPARTIDFEMSLGSSSFYGVFYPKDIKVIPGHPRSYVVSLVCTGISVDTVGVVVYDDQTPRPNRIGPHDWVQASSLSFLTDPGMLYSSNTDITDYSLYRFSIDSTGIVLKDSTRDLGGGTLTTDGTLLYQTPTLTIVDPKLARVNKYTTLFGGLSYALLPESSTNRLYVTEAAAVDSVLTNVLEVADLHSLSPLGCMRFPRPTYGDVTTILRWGDNGIALQVGSQEIMLLRTPLTGTPLATTSAPAPTVTSLSPDSALPGTAGLTISVTGSDFQPSSIVKWNGSNRHTTFVNATTLTATLTASDLANVGASQITVFTPAPGGGTSSSVAFTVEGPSLSPGSLTFPATMVGYGTGYQKVTFTNSSAVAVAVTPTITGPFMLRYNLCTGTIAPGASCDLMVVYLPQTGGPETGTLSVSFTGGAAPVVAALNGTGIAKIVVSSNALTFAATDIGYGAGAQKIGITNRTGAEINIAPVIDTAIAGTFRISTNGCTAKLAPNAGCYLWVNYIATYPGEQTGTLTITPTTGAVETVSLTGTGNAGQIVVTPTAVTYAATNLRYGAGAQKVGILNRTGANITISYAIDTPIAGTFSVSTNGCTGTLAPNSGCYLYVNYVATAIGQQQGTLTITPTGGGTVKTVSLTGTGQ